MNETLPAIRAEMNPSSLRELINPKNLPEAGFQSYEQFTNDSARQKAAFISGSMRNPSFEYSKFQNLSELDHGIVALGMVRDKLDSLTDDPDAAAVTAYTLDFRIAEMEYVKFQARIDYVVKVDLGQPHASLVELTDAARSIGHELYGKPKQEITDSALNELWQRIDAKKLHESAQVLYDELNNGCMWYDQIIEPLPRANDETLRLPKFENNPALAWAGEHIAEKNADIRALVDEYWQQAVEKHGEGYTCSPTDIAEVFRLVIEMRDPESTSGVTVRLDEDKASLSWESPEMAVVVGGKRGAITNSSELFHKVMHEFGVHGQRAINGLKTELPVLGTGLFTKTERPDYLTFEEGFATTVEEALSGVTPEWGAVNLGHYINISLAEEGADFRSVFERAWRYRLLCSVKDNQAVTEEMVAKQKSLAYGSCVRIFRGTQPDLAERTGCAIKSLTFNKDLAYLEGRVLAMNYLDEIYKTRDTDSLDRLFLAKYDATNPEQDRLARQYTKGVQAA